MATCGGSTQRHGVVDVSATHPLHHGESSSAVVPSEAVNELVQGLIGFAAAIDARHSVILDEFDTKMREMVMKTKNPGSVQSVMNDEIKVQREQLEHVLQQRRNTLLEARKEWISQQFLRLSSTCSNDNQDMCAMGSTHTEAACNIDSRSMPYEARAARVRTSSARGRAGVEKATILDNALREDHRQTSCALQKTPLCDDGDSGRNDRREPKKLDHTRPFMPGGAKLEDFESAQFRRKVIEVTMSLQRLELQRQRQRKAARDQELKEQIAAQQRLDDLVNNAHSDMRARGYYDDFQPLLPDGEADPTAAVQGGSISRTTEHTQQPANSAASPQQGPGRGKRAARRSAKAIGARHPRRSCSLRRGRAHPSSSSSSSSSLSRSVGNARTSDAVHPARASQSGDDADTEACWSDGERADLMGIVALSGGHLFQQTGTSASSRSATSRSHGQPVWEETPRTARDDAPAPPAAACTRPASNNTTLASMSEPRGPGRKRPASATTTTAATTTITSLTAHPSLSSDSSRHDDGYVKPRELISFRSGPAPTSKNLGKSWVSRLKSSSLIRGLFGRAPPIPSLQDRQAEREAYLLRESRHKAALRGECVRTALQQQRGRGHSPDTHRSQWDDRFHLPHHITRVASGCPSLRKQVSDFDPHVTCHVHATDPALMMWDASSSATSLSCCGDDGSAEHHQPDTTPSCSQALRVRACPRTHCGEAGCSCPCTRIRGDEDVGLGASPVYVLSQHALDLLKQQHNTVVAGGGATQPSTALDQQRLRRAFTDSLRVYSISRGLPFPMRRNFDVDDNAGEPPVDSEPRDDCDPAGDHARRQSPPAASHAASSTSSRARSQPSPPAPQIVEVPVIGVSLDEVKQRQIAAKRAMEECERAYAYGDRDYDHDGGEYNQNHYHGGQAHGSRGVGAQDALLRGDPSHAQAHERHAREDGGNPRSTRAYVEQWMRSVDDVSLRGTTFG